MIEESETRSYFLCYSRKDIEAVTTVLRILRMSGIQTWQDISDLAKGFAEDVIRQTISKDTSGVVFLCTSNSVQSEFIRTIELPEADSRARKAGEFSIIPLFGISPNDADLSLRDCLSVPLSSYSGAIIAPPQDQEDIARAALEAAALVLRSARIQDSHPLHVGLSSKQQPLQPVLFDLNFCRSFDNRYPDQFEWDEVFPRALNQFRREIAKRSISQLRVSGFCHLSLGALFGFVFRDRTGFVLEFDQVNKDGTTTKWHSAGQRSPHNFEFVDSPASVGSHNLVVKINLFSDDHGSITRYLGEAKLSSRAILDVRPPHYPYQVDGPEALTLAQELSQKIKAMHAKYGTTDVHLFCAIPLGLAILLGHNLNACGLIQCYEFDNFQRKYERACKLVDR